MGVISGILISLILLIILPGLKNYKIIREGYVGRYTTDNLPLKISLMFGRGLVLVENSSVSTPSLAEKWSVNDEGKKWELFVKDNIYWHDGKKFTIQDINYNFDNVSIFREGNKISFILNDPYVPFITLLEKPIFKNGLLGTGEWKVTKMTIRGGFIQNIYSQKDDIKKIIKFYPSEDQAKMAFKMGEIDVLKDVSNGSVFNNWKSVKTDKYTNFSQVVVLFINTEDSVMSDKNIRLSLNYSIDKNVFSSRAYSPISPESVYYNPQVKRYDYDLPKAKEFIKESKVPISEDYELKIISTPNLIDIAENLSESWKEIGIKSSILVSSKVPDNYQVFLTTFNIPKDPDQYSLWHSSQTQSNITRYKNMRIDKLLEDGRVELNPDERKKIYLDFQRYLMEDSPAIFLYHPVLYDIIRK